MEQDPNQQHEFVRGDVVQLSLALAYMEFIEFIATATALTKFVYFKVAIPGRDLYKWYYRYHTPNNSCIPWARLEQINWVSLKVSS